MSAALTTFPWVMTGGVVRQEAAIGGAGIWRPSGVQIMPGGGWPKRGSLTWRGA